MALIDITPIMTSNNTPAPYVVTASSEWDSEYSAWKAFNNVYGSDCWATVNLTITGWIMIDFAVKTKIDAFTIYARNNPTGTTGSDILAIPKSFSLYGSDDKVTFELIKDITNCVMWERSEGRLFKLDKSVNYRYYKIVISTNNGFASYSAIGNIKFWQDDGVQEAISNKNASLNYCLPSNSTHNMKQRQNDSREGLLGFANDPDDRYGTLYMIDDKGQAIIPKASMVEPVLLFIGLQGTENGTIILPSSIHNYKEIVIEWTADNTTEYRYRKLHSYMTKDIIFTSEPKYTWMNLSINHADGQYAFGTLFFDDEFTLRLANSLYNKYFTHYGITRVYGIR